MKKAKMPEDTKLQHIPQPSEAAKLPQLPPLSIDTMTQVELQDFIPQLVSIMMTNRTGLYRKNSRPEWWPSDLPWTGTKTDLLYQENNWSEPLRDAIRKCYRHMGQERLLKMTRRDNKQVSTTSSRSKPEEKLDSSSSYYTNPTDNKKKPCQYAEIYICYFCESEFSDRTLMREHQAQCKERPPQLQEALKTPPTATDPTQGPPQMSPVKLNLSCKAPKIPKDGFIKMFNLVPTQKVDKILARHRNSLDVECEELDYSVPETPISPTTPRTPKSLISQLSRDEGPSSRKRLSYTEGGDNEDKESVVSGCSEEAEEKATQKGKSLLTIDISSLLGQRIQKHVKADSFLQVIGDSESFCKTPVKNSFYEKLRNRTISYPVLYKQRRKHDGKFVHAYGFTNGQKREIKKRLKSGLNKKSRELQKGMPKCSVEIARLTKWELKRFMSKHSYRKFLNLKPEVSTSESEFPKEPLLLSQNVDKLLGLKKRSELNVAKLNRLAPVNVVSEDANAEITKHKLTLYRCLLSDLATMQSSLKKSKSTHALQQSLKLELKQVPLERQGSDKALTVKVPGHRSPKLPLSPPTTPSILMHQDRKSRKQSSKLTEDDISIISISSDEESLSSRCCMACKRKKLCPCSPEVSLNRVCSSPSGCALSVSIASSTSVTPQVSPCSCISSPESESSLHLKLSPSPDLVQWHVKALKPSAAVNKTGTKPLRRSDTDTPVSSSTALRLRSNSSTQKQDTIEGKDKSVVSKSPVKKAFSTSTPKTSPHTTTQKWETEEGKDRTAVSKSPVKKALSTSTPKTSHQSSAQNQDTREGKDKSVLSKSPVKKALSTSTPRTSSRKLSQQSGSPASSSTEVKVQSVLTEKDKSAMKKMCSEESNGMKQSAVQKSPQKKASPLKNSEGQYELIIRTRSRAGIQLKRSKRIMSASEGSPRGSPKKIKLDTR